MQKIRIVVLAGLTLLLALSGVTTAQDQLPVEINLARQHLERNRPDRALKELSSFFINNPDSEYLSTAYLLKARCHLKLGETTRAVEAVKHVLQLNNDNEIKAQTHYLLATVYQAQGDVYGSAVQLIECLNYSPELSTRDQAKKHMKELAEGAVAYRLETLKYLARSKECVEFLDSLAPEMGTDPSIGVLLMPAEGDDDSLAQEQLLDGIMAAASLYSEGGIPSSIPVKRPSEKIRIPESSIKPSPLPEEAPKPESDDLEELLLDLVGEPAPVVQVSLEGMKVVHRSIEANAAQAVLETRDLIRQEGVWALVLYGPESECMAASVEAQAHGIPVVLAGQRRPGLFAIGPTTVQPEADWYEEGRQAAIYAADSLGLKTYAIVAPATPMGQANVAGFLEILKEREAEDIELLSLEWYFPNEGISLNRQFQRIRQIGFKREFADSLMKSEEADSLFHIDFTDSLYAQEFGDSLEARGLDIYEDLVDKYWTEYLQEVRLSPAFKSGEIDSNDIELKTIDAFYFPIEPGTIELFAPQFAFYNFKTTRIGNSSWYNPDELYRQRQYVDDLVFTSSLPVTSIDTTYKSLSQSLFRINGESPSIWHIRGYEALEILAHSSRSRYASRGALADGVRSLRELKIDSFIRHYDPEKRISEDIWIYTIKEGEVVPEDIRERRIKTAPDLDELEEEILPDPLAPKRRNR